MSRSSQTLLSRFAFSAIVAASLTFGGVQALSGSSARSNPPVCVTRPYDPNCEAYCRSKYPENDGAHFCGRVVPGGYECTCME